MAPELRLDLGLVPDQDHLVPGRPFCCDEGSFHNNGRSRITTHRINGDPHWLRSLCLLRHYFPASVAATFADPMGQLRLVALTALYRTGRGHRLMCATLASL